MTTPTVNVPPVRYRTLRLVLGPGLVVASLVLGALKPGLALGCIGLLAMPIGLCVCLIGLFWKPRWPHAAALVLGLSVIGYSLAESSRLASGHLRPSDYPLLLQRMGGSLKHFPRTIPSHAANVRLTAFGVFDWFPAQDSLIELRYSLPGEEAEQVRAQAEKAAITPDPKVHGSDLHSIAAMFIRNQGGDPAAFKSYVLFIPTPGMNAGGVSVNTTTGEVIYWLSW